MSDELHRLRRKIERLWEVDPIDNCFHIIKMPEFDLVDVHESIVPLKFHQLINLNHRRRTRR